MSIFAQNEHWREIYAVNGREALGRLEAILRRGTGYFVGDDVIVCTQTYATLQPTSDHLGGHRRFRISVAYERELQEYVAAAPAARYVPRSSERQQQDQILL